LRGGSWSDNATDSRAAIRFGITATNRSNYIGFRLARIAP
jgi:formylglycine-generating enzyme required for sulfatase activity